MIEPRSIINSEWYTDIPTMHLYRHCRLRANYTESEWRGIGIKCGQFVTSLQTLSNETGLSVQQVRTALHKLETTGYITSKSTNKNRIITVKNYHSEQFCNRQTNRQITTDNNINNITTNIVGQAPTAYSEEIGQVIEYLNRAAGTGYKPDTKSTVRHIGARLREGYAVEDFKRVIDSKVHEWKGTDFAKYLRPDTLFGMKFESYLNAAPCTEQNEIQRLMEGYNR